MYASRTVCSRCSSQLRSAAAQRVGARAWYASLADSPDSFQSTSTSNNEAETQRAPLGRRSQQAQKTFKTSNDPALALFNDIVSPAATQQKIGTARPALGELEIAGKISELTSRDDLSLHQQYRIFQSEIWPHIQKLAGRLPKGVYHSTTKFLGTVREGIVKDAIKEDTVELAQQFSRIGRWDLDIRNDLIMSLCYKLVMELENPASTEIPALMKELVDLWKHVSQLKRPSEVGKELRFVMPGSHEVLRDIDRSKKDRPRLGDRTHPTTKALASIFLQFNIEQIPAIMPGLLATMAVLSDPKIPQTNATQEAAPLLHLVGLVLGKHPPGDGFIAVVFERKSRVPYAKRIKLKNYVRSHWGHITGMLFQQDAEWKTGLHAAADPELKSLLNISTFHKQLRTAYQSRNTGAIMSIWQNLTLNMEHHPELARQLRGDREFLDYWIFIWCAIRRPMKVQETMQLMKDLDIQPTVKTYTAMMHGWKMCKDADKIEMLWQQLQKSGMKLDTVIWTERISSLIEIGKAQDGIRALSEMVNNWKEAAKEGRQHQVGKPTIEVVNAAFKGLIRVDPRAANEVLAWAGREGFVPNVRTYNILLKESFRSDHAEDVQGLLKSMKGQGVDPDAATFTIILEEVLGRMGDAEPEEQVHAVKQVFNDIETAGLRPNMETYGKMLYAVASLASGSDEAIAAVQEHMRGNGFNITPHMVTILIERALNRDPPDISAVRDLLKEHKLKNVEQGDQTLWERVMSAFAIAGEKDQAMQIFNDLADKGRPVTSLPCLTDLLKMLLAAEDRESAKNVIDVVLRHKMTTKEDFKERYWRHHFWYLAKENRLLTGEQAPHLFE